MRRRNAKTRLRNTLAKLSAEPRTFLRFIGPSVDPTTCARHGLFAATIELRDSGRASADELQEIKSHLTWFSAELPSPHYSLFPVRAVFWFRASAKECVRRAWALTNLLRGHGIVVDVIRSARPGHILYLDAFQVAVVPGSRGQQG